MVKMSWQDAMEVVITRTKNERYRILTADDHPMATEYRRIVLEMAGQDPKDYPELDFPSIMKQAKNVAEAIGRATTHAIAAGSISAVWVGSEVLGERRGTCRACPYLREDRCVLCGCFYEQKIRLATEECPDSPPRWKRTA
jgi:hypothetical protein